jgi:hypothetical protein
VLSAPRTWLALHRGELDKVVPLEPIDLARIPHEYALASTAARLDALAALKERSSVEQYAPKLLETGTYLEPFAMRALGVVRDDEPLVERAAARFEAMGLTWHAAQSRELLAPRIAAS